VILILKNDIFLSLDEKLKNIQTVIKTFKDSEYYYTSTY